MIPRHEIQKESRKNIFSALKKKGLAKLKKNSRIRIGIKFRKIMSNKKNYSPILKSVAIGEVEINKNCNLNCVMCKSQDSKRKNEYLDLNIFEKTCAEAKLLGNKKVNIYTIGEPLLNPFLDCYLEILKKYDLKAVISTNGLLLHKNNNMELLSNYKEAIEEIRFSVDGATKVTYEKIRTYGSFDKLLENLELFNKANKERIFNVSFSSILSTDNKDEIAKYYYFYSKYTDMKNIKINIMNGLCPDNKYFFHANVFPSYIRKNMPCENWLFNKKIHILCNGEVTACCRDYHGDLIYGNIMDSSAQELINNDKIVSLRVAHLNNRVPEDILCHQCYSIDQRVSDLFKLFSGIMVYKYKSAWDIEHIQSKFDAFFEYFNDKLPERKDFVKLCK